MKDEKFISTLEYVIEKCDFLLDANENIYELLKLKYGIDLNKEKAEYMPTLESIFLNSNYEIEKKKDISRLMNQYYSNYNRLFALQEVIIYMKDLHPEMTNIGEAIVKCEHCGHSIDLNESDTCDVCGKSIFMNPNDN